MKNKISLLFTLALLLGILSSCEKDGTKLSLNSDPTKPAITSMPDLTLSRANGTQDLTFGVSPVEPGFTASATYFLEACPSGNNFANKVTILNKVVAKDFVIQTSELNGLLMKIVPADVASQVDFRLRSVLVVDGGTGAPGTGDNTFEYISDVKTATVTPYGLPRLDLVGSGITQSIRSKLGDGVYEGFVKLDITKPFTLLDPETNVSYGLTAGTIAANGAAITPAGDGWYILKVNLNDHTSSFSQYAIGLVGSATPNGWNTPDQKMDYNAATDTWEITANLVVGEIKFRKNDGWAWNLGWNSGKNSLEHNGANIAVDAAGNYSIALTITNDNSGSETGTFTIKKN